MKVSKLIKELEKAKKEYGNLYVMLTIDTMTDMTLTTHGLECIDVYKSSDFIQISATGYA